MTDFKLMPTEPTEDMARAGIIGPTLSKSVTRAIYAAMCEAAPSPWRPIEEAPDGSQIVSDGELWGLAGRLVGANGPTGEWLIMCGRFFHHENKRFELANTIIPTHFIPLSILGIPGGINDQT